MGKTERGKAFNRALQCGVTAKICAYGGKMVFRCKSFPKCLTAPYGRTVFAEPFVYGGEIEYNDRKRIVMRFRIGKECREHGTVNFRFRGGHGVKADGRVSTAVWRQSAKKRIGIAGPCVGALKPYIFSERMLKFFLKPLPAFGERVIGRGVHQKNI